MPMPITEISLSTIIKLIGQKVQELYPDMPRYSSPVVQAEKLPAFFLYFNARQESDLSVSNVKRLTLNVNLEYVEPTNTEGLFDRFTDIAETLDNNFMFLDYPCQVLDNNNNLVDATKKLRFTGHNWSFDMNALIYNCSLTLFIRPGTSSDTPMKNMTNIDITANKTNEVNFNIS